MGIKDSSLWAREILSFLETAKNGSINGTAEANAMKQSNLSRTLKSLEEKLKCQLLERGYNGVRLTENGREVFKVACDLDKVIYKVKNFTISDKNVSGKIRLWTSDGLGTGYLSNCLSEFIAKYPDVKIEVVCSLDTPGSFSRRIWRLFMKSRNLTTGKSFPAMNCSSVCLLPCLICQSSDIPTILKICRKTTGFATGKIMPAFGRSGRKLLTAPAMWWQRQTLRQCCCA